MVITNPAPASLQLELFRDGIDAGSAGPIHPTDDELMERLAQCEREDRTLLRMVLAAAFATAVLGVAGGLAM
jgi:hypothetical protein